MKRKNKSLNSEKSESVLKILKTLVESDSLMGKWGVLSELEKAIEILESEK